MAPHPPQTAAGDSASLAAYHSAYNGYASDRNGRFTQFIRLPDKSHLENGYWRFTSSQDERLAFERGYHTPEDILVAADSGEHNDDINLLWVPGAVDPNLKSQISGCAMSHLRNIYDMRILLQKALSFRGRVPTYPISHHLKEYWEVRRTALSLRAEQYAVQASTGPTPLPLQGAEGPSPVVAAGHQAALSRRQRTHKSQGIHSFDPVITTTTSSVVRSPAQSPDMPGTPPAFNHSIPPKSPPKPARVSQHAENTAAPSQPAVHHATSPNRTASASIEPTHPIAQPYNVAPYLQNTPHRHPGQAQDVKRPHASQTPRIPAPRNVQSQQSPRNLAAQPLRQRPRPLQVALPSFLQQSNTQAPDQVQSGSMGSSTVFSPYKSSPYTPPPGQYTTPPLGPAGDPPPAGDAQYYSASHTGAGHNQQHHETASRTHAKVQASTTDNAVPRHQQLNKQALSIDPRLAQRDHITNTRFSPPITPLSFDNDDCYPVASGQEAPDHELGAEPGKAINDRPVAVYPQPANPRRTEPEEGHAKSPKRPLEADCDDEVQRSKRRKSDNYRDEGFGRAVPKEQCSPPAALDIYAELPCMDCGETEGHKWGCHLDIVPMKNLTILDYRNLAENVQRLDPGPWTTHQGPPPEPEPEDPEAEIQGMADIIRNEDTYRNDADLHLLPDAMMITLWALKTSPNIEVVYE